MELLYANELPVTLSIPKDLDSSIRKGKVNIIHAHVRSFTYSYSLIRDGGAIPFTAYARSPTVTMPRLKAITTGSIPSFVDLILNIDEGDKSSALATQDTWLAQLKAKETGKVLMYGDDTWLKLFPDFFDRHDGTSSFFVAVSDIIALVKYSAG